MPLSSSSSSDEEEASRLLSVAVDSAHLAQLASLPRPSKTHLLASTIEPSEDRLAPGALKLYQIRAQNLLHSHLDKTFGARLEEKDGDKEQITSCNNAAEDDLGFRLFRRAPPGFSYKHHGKGAEHVSRRNSKTHDIGNCDEESEEFQLRLVAAAIDGTAIKAGAEKAIAKALSSALAEEAAAKEAARVEEERVALLKKHRGEEWLPSVARDMLAGELDEGAGIGIENNKVQNFVKELRSGSSLKSPGNRLPDVRTKHCKVHNEQIIKKGKKKKKKKNNEQKQQKFQNSG